jgi:hypothetical protein
MEVCGWWVRWGWVMVEKVKEHERFREKDLRMMMEGRGG